MNDRITDPITARLGDSSDTLANANGLHGYDSFLRNSKGEPLELGAASNNAIAHALSSAYLAYDYSPAAASLLGWLREYNSYRQDPDRTYAWDTFKDLYNNQVGRNIADYVRSNNLSRDQIQDLVLDALTTRKLIVTHEDKRIDPSFDGNPSHFALPDGGALPWTGPSAGFADFAPTVTRVPIAPPLAPSPLQGSPPPMPAFWPHAEYSPAGDSFGNFPRMSGNAAPISPTSFMAKPPGFSLRSSNENLAADVNGMVIRPSPNLPTPPLENEGPIGIFSGKPMPRWPIPPPIFDTRDNSNVASGNRLTSALLRDKRVSQPSSLDTNGSQVPLAPNGQDSATTAPSDPDDAFDPLASPAQNSEGPLSLNDAYLEYLKRLNANQPPVSASEPSAPAAPPNPSSIAQPPDDDGPLTLMEAYLQYRKRLDASQPQASAFDAGAPLVPSDDFNFSGGLVGRLTALMRQYPDVYGPPPPEDDEMPSYYPLMLNR
jgi:hypothetical protein